MANKKKSLEELIRYHDHLYYVAGEPEITDAQYDRLVVQRKALGDWDNAKREWTGDFMPGLINPARPPKKAKRKRKSKTRDLVNKDAKPKLPTGRYNLRGHDMWFHILVDSDDYTVTYKDVYLIPNSEEANVFTRHTSRIGWELDMEKGELTHDV